MKPLLSPKEIAEAIDASESSIKRWIDSGRIKATKTSGGHRKVDISEAIRFIRDHKHKVNRADILGFPDADTVRTEEILVDSTNTFYRYLLEGQAQKARGIILGLYLQGESIATICDGPIRNAMTRMGDLWQHDKSRVRFEHQATDICIQILNLIRTTLPQNPKAPIAIGGAPPDDPYIIPSLCVVTVLLSEGLQSINLGPNTPFESFESSIRDYVPALTWMSLSVEHNHRIMRKHLDRLAEVAHSHQSKLIVGGRYSRQVKSINHSNLIVVSTMQELVAFLKGYKLSQST